MTDKELRAFNDCMEANAWYNVHAMANKAGYAMRLIAEVYLMRTETLTHGH